MLRVITILVFSFFTLSSYAQTKHIEKIEITDSSITFNNECIIVFPITVESISSYLGTPRIDTIGTSNSIAFWDSIGIMAFFPKNSNQIRYIDICLAPSFYYETKNYYNGKIFIKGKSIKTNLNQVEFESLFTKTETKGWLKILETKFIEVIFEFDEDSKTLNGIEIGQLQK